ncbi:hypothetical protein DOT_0882 [Desulfosporosinus sp. OT]|nr:hypothetical protein DOT_0882 [Desulfosporosinus sp. OT]
MGHFKAAPSMALLSLGARYVVEQRIPEIWDNMKVVTRLREYAER